MIARCTFVQVAPEDVDECVEIFNDRVRPAAKQLEGFRGLMLLVHEDDGRAITIDLCDSREEALSNERHGFYQQEIAHFAERLIGTPRREIYEVRSTAGIVGGPELLTSES